MVHFQHDMQWMRLFAVIALALTVLLNQAETRRLNGNLTACQHLRRAETRRAKSLLPSNRLAVRVPRCNKRGAFEPIQCSNEKNGSDCWCVDEYGFEIPKTRNATRSTVRCAEPENCNVAACRMFCPAGFARDPDTGCSICRCRDICEGVKCPNGQICQQQEVKCKNDNCPPLPTCKKARSIRNYCSAGLPLVIEGSDRPFLCGIEPGKPQCPPLLYQCQVEPGNDYGVCCPSSHKFEKPGLCPAIDTVSYSETTGYMCGSPCTHDLECPTMEKCCFTKGCKLNCQKPGNVTICHQARALSNVLAINEREGRGYQPDCSGPEGLFAPRQCSRNGLVCWCVDPRTGHKIPSTMGAANMVNCDGWENMIGRSLARSFSQTQCDHNICAAICEYGFKNDHNGCPTCECSEPCEGFKCAIGSHCEVARDPMCESGSTFCSSWPVCKPDLLYSNPCNSGTPLASNVTGEAIYCQGERKSRSFQPKAFFDSEPDTKQARSMTNRITCPTGYTCTKLHGEPESVCCPLDTPTTSAPPASRQQTMCEYLRDFSDRMEGTESGMKLALPAPRCTDDGDYKDRQCSMRRIQVTRAEQRKILEENTIRRMRMLLSQNAQLGQLRPKRHRRNLDRLKLYRVDDSALKVNVASPMTGRRSAKVVDDAGAKHQELGQLFETDFKKVVPAPKRPINDTELVEIEVEECWCVDSFGTEIPHTRGFNVSDESCSIVKKQLDCLDLTCRMGCEYGFTLDIDTSCPICQCRDACTGVECGDSMECRIVDVSCDEEYCPPVPACLPRKPGQCPFLVPPGSDNLDANICGYECRTDSHCEGSKRCCSNGCGTQCVEPQMKTACQHLHTIQMHQASELGIPAMKMPIVQCDSRTGRWNEVQCSPNGMDGSQCWCVDTHGQEISGTRVQGKSPVCEQNSAFDCPKINCSANATCDAGYKMDTNGCQTCKCRNFCDEISCGIGETCQLISVECIDTPCPPMPICVPGRESVCPEGSPLKQGDDLEVSCGPQQNDEACPTTHSCQLNPVSNRGVCCRKTRDVCFESLDNACLAKSTTETNITRYRFSPKANRCISVVINANESGCQSKNLFHSEIACNSVCPVLTQCERLKLKNSLAAQRTGHSSVWFKPRCDPVTGHWSPVQCLGSQPMLNVNAVPDAQSQNLSSPNGVCWCADKKGAPLKGTLTRDSEPTCNGRQGRRLGSPTSEDTLMEELITHMTLLSDIDNVLDDQIFEQPNGAESENFTELWRRVEAKAEERSDIDITIPPTAAEASITEHSIQLSNSLLYSQLSIETVKPMEIKRTRCRALKDAAPFPISCDTNGAFAPTQCNSKVCWCVDEAGNQLDSSDVFEHGAKRCVYTPIGSVGIELFMQNTSIWAVRNVYDIIRAELHKLLGDAVENLRVQDNLDGTVIVRFELHNNEKIDMAYAIETAITAGKFQLAGGYLRADITRSHFTHQSLLTGVNNLPINDTNSVLQLTLFIITTSLAFVVSILFVYVVCMKRDRGETKKSHYAGNALFPPDKPVDYSAPIFVLNTTTDYDSIKGPIKFDLDT